MLARILLLATALSPALAQAQGALAATKPAQNAAPQVVTLNVEGLNCAACTDDVKAALKQASQATRVDSHMECGRIYLSTPANAKVNELAIRLALSSNGINLKNVEASIMPLESVRKAAAC